MMEEFVLDGKKLLSQSLGEPKAVFMMFLDAMKMEETLEEIISATETEDYAVVAVSIDSWSNELSPWAMETSNMSFKGNGQETLDYIGNILVPYIFDSYGSLPIYAAGYSLAGLFSLYVYANNRNISGFLSASGSMWYKDAKKLFDYRKKCQNDVIYISLGDKEAKTGNPVMRQVLVKTEELVNTLKKNEAKVVFEMNPGGHFNEPSKRLAKGIDSIIRRL